MRRCSCYPQMIKDVGLLNRLVGIQVPLNISEGDFATKPITAQQMRALSEYTHSFSDTPKTVPISAHSDRSFSKS